MYNHKQRTCNIAVGHRHVFKALYITGWYIVLCYNGFILLQIIYLMMEHRKIADTITVKVVGQHLCLIFENECLSSVKN